MNSWRLCGSIEGEEWQKELWTTRAKQREGEAGERQECPRTRYKSDGAVATATQNVCYYLHMQIKNPLPVHVHNVCQNNFLKINIANLHYL